MSLIRSRVWLLFPFAGLIVGFAIALATGLWIGHPFPGFRYSTFEFVSSGGLPGWTGIQAGLQPDDQVRLLEAQEPSGRDALRRRVLAVPVGTVFHYTVESEGERRDLAIATQVFTATDFMLTNFHFLLLGFLYVLIGAFPYWRNPHDTLARAHLVWATSLGCFFFFNIDEDASKVLPGLYYPSLILATASTVYLALVFPRPFAWVARIGPALRFAGVGTGVAAVGLLGANALALAGDKARFAETFMAVNRVLLLAAASSVVFFLFAVAWKWVGSRERFVKRQCGTVLGGATIAFVPLLVTWLIPFGLGRNDPNASFWYNATVLSFAAFPAALGTAIVRYKLFDLNLIIKRTLTYAVSVSAALAGYFALTAGLKSLLLLVLHQPGDLVSQAVSTAVIALLFAPLRDLTRAALDRAFDRTGYDFESVVAEYTLAAGETIDTVALAEKLAGLVEPALHPRSFGVYARTPEGRLTPLWVVGTVGTEVEPGGLQVPLVVGTSDVGLLTVGPKRSDQGFSDGDRRLVESLGQALALTLKNAQLFRQLAGQERLKRDLEIATEVQMGFLPTNIAIPKGALISVSCTPASEVGGDFYDFVQIDATRWGVIVGDVAGKGVPAALMMAASLIIFRTVAPGIPSPAAVLARMNKLVHRNRPSRKTFVTAVYMVYDARTGLVRIANAGQPKPLLNGRPVEIKGLPLGVNTQATYREIEVALAPFDSLVAYSDGLEDMENEAGEQWGPERVEAFFRAAARELPSEARLALVASLKAFSGEAPAADDLTLAILQRRPDTMPFGVQARTGPLVLLESHATASLE